jgi:hypothetical protein
MLMCPIQYQSLLVILYPPDGMFQGKVENQLSCATLINYYVTTIKGGGKRQCASIWISDKTL